MVSPYCGKEAWACLSIPRPHFIEGGYDSNSAV